jgi:hypothetical protein
MVEHGLKTTCWQGVENFLIKHLYAVLDKFEAEGEGEIGKALIALGLFS